MRSARIVALLSALLSAGALAPPETIAGSPPPAGTSAARERSFILAAGQTKVDLESSFIVPGTDSVTLDGMPLARDGEYRLNLLRGTLLLVRPAAGGERLVVRFRRHPFAFSPVFALRFPEGETPPATAGIPEKPRAPAGGRGGEAYQLRLSGSKTVGITAGSNRDLGLDQSLKVSMTGKVARDLEVNAYLTDDNLPVQPEGNTEELRHLDKVSVQVKSRHAEVQLGDFAAGLDWSRFSSFSRELRGGIASVSAGGQVFTAGGGIAKGRFRTVNLRGREGVQGPYELLSARRVNGVIILPGTEAVYVNGRTVKRGSENDYVIDYARGTVTFTERLPITDDSEIVIEYQMGEESYERTNLLAGWTSPEYGKILKLRTFFYQEGDDRGKLLAGSLSAEDRTILESAGDDASKAMASGIEEVAPGAGRYILVPADTLPAHFEFVESGGNYRLSFYEAGAGAGDYRVDGFSTRGDVRYRFVGEGKGDYRIGRPLPLPERRRLVSVGAAASRGAFFADAEGNVSWRDRNLLSSVDDGDNAGGAMRVEVGVRNLDLGSAALTASGDVSTLESRFAPPDKPREPYFYRSWGLEDVVLDGREILGGGSVSLARGDSWSIGGGYRALERTGGLSARKADAKASIGSMLSRGLAIAAFRSSAGEERERRFAQGDGIFSFWHLAPRLTLEAERYRAFVAAASDTGRAYRQGTIAVAGRSIGDYRANVAFTRRVTDNLRAEGRSWYRAREADEVGFDGAYSSGPRIVELALTHRESRDEEFGLSESHDLARLRARSASERHGVAGDVSYRISSGEERTRERTVIFVGENQGDYDAEGREVGQKRGDYMLLYLPGDRTEAVRSVELSFQASIGSGVRGLGGEDGGGWLSAIRRQVSLDHSLSVLEKSRTDDLWRLYTLSPSLLQRGGVTVYGVNRLREELGLFNASKAFKLRFVYSREDEEDNRSTSASVDVFVREVRIRAESAPFPSVSFTWEGASGLRARGAEGPYEQRYRVRSLSGSQIANYRFSPSAKLSVELGLEKRADDVSLAEQISYSATPSLAVSAGKNVYLSSYLRFTYTDSRAEAGKPLFFLEEGLREDWNLNGQYRFTRNVSFGINYTGRREKDYRGEVKTVHDFKMESRAYF